MKIQGTFQAAIIGLHCKENTQGKPESYLDVEIRVAKDDAKKQLGDHFEQLANVATQQIHVTDEDGDHEEQLVASVKPSKHVICEMHSIKLEGQLWTDQPKLSAIRPGDGGTSVIAQLRIPLAEASGAAAKAVLAVVGKTVALELNPQQGEFTFDAAKGREPKVIVRRGKKSKGTDDEATAAH